MGASINFNEKKGFICDMDGVIYHGNRILPGVAEFIQWLHEEDKEYLFLTNNSGYTPRELNQKLARMGLDVPEEHFYTSALPTAAFLREQAPGCSVFAIGEAGLLNALYDAGITMNDVNPDYVVVGEGRSYSLDTLTKATNLVMQGAKLIGANSDVSGPIENGIAPACRALIAPIEMATGKQAYFCGKPNPLMMRTGLKMLNCHSAEAVMVGDRMDTDVISGMESGMSTVLVLSGVSTRETLRTYAYRPSIVLDGVTLYDSEQHINLTPQQRGVGYLFQSYALFPNMTVRANILTGLRREKDAAKKQAAFEHAIHLLKLEGLEDRRPARLSGGQAQRVALARMLVSRPKALLLDEPFSAIDSHLRDQLQVDLLALLADFPGDMVIVTHSRDEAYHMCGQIAVMDAGRVLAHGPTKQVFADPRTVQGGRLTGCKNIFPARKVDDHTIFVPDWGVDLHPARMVEDGLVAMGVRAHSFRPEEVRNPLAVHCVGKMEEPFEWIIRMRAEGQTAGSPDLWWRVSKEIVPETMPTRLGVAPEQVLLFYE